MFVQNSRFYSLTWNSVEIARLIESNTFFFSRVDNSFSKRMFRPFFS